MRRRDLATLVVALLAAAVVAVGLGAAIGNLCPSPTDIDPCPAADRNRLLVVGLAGTLVGLIAATVAFTLEYAARRIAYRGAWTRAARRGALIGLVVGAMAGLRLADALTAFSASVVVALAAGAEWLAIRRWDCG